MKEKNNPVGTHFPLEAKTLVRERVEELGVAMSSYLRDLAYKDIGLPAGEEGNRVAKLILANRQLEEETRQLKRENQRLRYEGKFTEEAVKYERIEIVSDTEIIFPKQVEQLV